LELCEAFHTAFCSIKELQTASININGRKLLKKKYLTYRFGLASCTLKPKLVPKEHQTLGPNSKTPY